MQREFASVDTLLNPFPVYQDMRQTEPVYLNPDSQSWNVFKYEDVYKVLSDYNVYSSQFAGVPHSDFSTPFAASLISTDPPRHRQLRSLVTQAFTPRAVENLAPRIQEIVDEYLDKVIPVGEMDLVQALSTPLPVTVIAQLLGIPVSDRERFKHWSDQVVGAATFGEDVDYTGFLENNAIMEMMQYFLGIMEQRKNHPEDDLISGLLAANLDGQTLSQIELLGFCALLLVAGNETTTNLITNAMMTFAEQPELWEQLRNDPELLPSAMEEVLRYRSPVQCMFRVAKQDTVIAGQEIQAGSRMVAWIGSANHDEDQFERPEDFIIDRTPNRHLAFGQGIHYCLGAPLARLEARIALTEMLERFQSFHIKKGTELQRLPGMLIYGIRALPIEFQRA